MAFTRSRSEVSSGSCVRSTHGKSPNTRSTNPARPVYLPELEMRAMSLFEKPF